MKSLLQPWQLLLLILSGWNNRHQQEVIEYLRTKNQVLKEIIKGSAIGSSNQATKWATLSARSHAASDSVACCGITIAKLPGCLYAWHRALGKVAAWGLLTLPFASPKKRTILNSTYRANSDIATNSSVEIATSLARQSPNSPAIAYRLIFFTLREILIKVSRTTGDSLVFDFKLLYFDSCGFTCLLIGVDCARLLSTAHKPVSCAFRI